MLWDLDGTLADSLDLHWRAWRDTLAAEGVPLTYEQFLWSFGQRNDAILGTWLGASATPETARRAGMPSIDVRQTTLADLASDAFQRLVEHESP